MDNNLIEALVHDYSRLVFTICLRMVGDRAEAENLTQDTFLTACEKLPSGEGCNYKGWLTAVAANRCRDYLKSARFKREIASSEPPEPVTGGATEREAGERLFIQALKEACEKLPEPYRTVARLRYVEDMEVAEISKCLSREQKTVSTQIYRARDKLKVLLKGWCA